ncbi:indolepyruvate ferredoxin oxidoreductase family protein [Trinickia caryophylli]|uniref:Indolepyruvate ferredoxin oxidoreductase n=1 Tax=Trinickia caryophylli TaxID=28094 RepID=A0A1X7ELI6_TRICW|nr:indolepyruvate ferredoxin oxidoreductase family protein [Trinickia caryophylli]PMS08851.1 pyruvate ferredoxin oxidoreductase [Trinickia caryophylli]TRX18789.1 indolepyruvate ferredoxin oxidoreductase family protein [Trinickia caryophylli]WQE10414.1 indolepyruvate ferredoxin oxidoreductase family protein [Trinickia caryophylli]SMF36017.1 indolepyruvate ferredoxin oxidoreductase [Trinickia caryophylli]GLU32761.1 2-oxoacid ferredoxin oxidoreductase [Trinickia caryophylli]
MTARQPIAGTPPLADYRLADNLTAVRGRIFLTGTQALVRLMLMQRRLDRARTLRTAGFMSGYRGSPLGMVDQQMWKAKKLLDAHDVRFLPAINEELGGTAVLGTQRIEADPERTVDGVFAMWYGKGPGVDRAGDALKHGNAYGASPHGGVLVVAGDDHGCVSSSMPHQSDFAMIGWHMPIVNPSNVAEMLEFGLYGFALSRFSGAWVGFKAISETVESGATVDLDALQTEWSGSPEHVPPADGLHNRWPDLPSLAIEARLAAKLDAVRSFARANSIDKWIAPSPRADVGIVTCGKAHLDLMEALRRLDLSPADLDAAGVRIYKVGLSFPLETSRIDRFVDRLREVLVIEEKGPVVEQQIKDHLYNRTEGSRPVVIGKHDAAGASLVAALGELRPSRVLPVLADWLARHRPALDRRERVVDLVAPAILSNAADAVRRTPYFCSGCPHNTSTKVPEGSIAQAGIGCHFMASWMDRDTTGLIQMGGEGVDWVAHSMFTRTRHVFQNLGDGTYFHSGILAIRQAVAARANITYKILYNDAVAMTGGQPVDGSISVPQIARQVEAEGVSRFVVVSDEPHKYDGHHDLFPKGTTFHPRSELDAVQRELREVEGVSVLIYDQTCAAEKRRRRKKGQYPDPDKRLFINEEVCEGCGDCGVQSNCLSVEPVETPLGRKRRIDQSSCNKDFSCVGGFCPSFVTVEGATLKKAAGVAFDEASLAARVDALPQPATTLDAAPYDILVTGVGGTGVVTVGALISMAAHLEGKSASVLDFMGFAQKGGSVLSFVRFAQRDEWLNQVRIDTQQADLLLACDMVVGASADALQTVRHGRTRIVVNTHPIPNAAFVRDPDASLHADALLDKMGHAAGAERLATCDAQALAGKFLGDTIGANMLMLGFAWQLGLVPVSHAALMRAIELNDVAVPMNKLAFAIGRLAAGDTAALEALWAERHALPATAGRQRTAAPDELDALDALVADREARLAAYGGPRYVARYRALVDAAREAARIVPGAGIAEAVAATFYRLLAVKDEYEVARLHCAPEFRAALEAQFEGEAGRNFRVKFNLAPPMLAKPDSRGVPRKMTFGQWLWPALGVLAKWRVLRGTAFDPFGRTLERRMERALADDYEVTMRQAFVRLDPSNAGDPATHATLAALASLHARVRGYGHVKLANLASVKRTERELAARLAIEPATSDAVQAALAAAKGAGSLRGIPVVVAR